MIQALAIFLVLAVSAPTKEEQARAKAHFDEAQIQYNLGRFEEAFVEYQRAYELAPFPDLLFNMGQCRRNLKDYDRALFFFKSYVRDAPRAEDRKRVNQLITQLEKERAREAKTARPVETSTVSAVVATANLTDEEPSVRPAVPPDITETPKPQPQLVREPPATAEEDDDPIYGEWWFWTAIVVVGAAAVGGMIAATNRSDDTSPMGSIGTINGTED